MKRGIGVLTVACIALLTFSSSGRCENDTYYARCNLKVLKDNSITWVNWQATPSFIPAGTKLKVVKEGAEATLTNPETGTSYRLDVGADGDQYLAKFVTKKPVNIKSFSEVVQSNIRNAVAKVGMTKEQAYIAMGPPATVGTAKTNQMTYEGIMSSDLWIYARRRLSKNIGVAFDPATGKVNRTEGIWGK